MIGLQRVGGTSSSSSSSSSIVGLRTGCILGRSPQSSALPGGLPRPPKDPLRPDLGMTTANAPQVSRHECTVEEVTSISVTLFIPDRLYGNPSLYKPLIVRKENATRTNTWTNVIIFSSPVSFSLQEAAVVPNQRFTLFVGDVLIFQTGRGFEDHPFQVVAMPTTSSSSSSSWPTRKRDAAPTRIVSHTTNHDDRRATPAVPMGNRHCGATGVTINWHCGSVASS